MNLIIIGGGKSVKECFLSADDWSLLRSIPDTDIWALNSAYKPLPFIPNAVVWSDKSFFENEQKNLLDISSKGVILMCKSHGAKYYSAYPQIQTFQTHREQNKCDQESYYNGSAGLSGLLALSIAYKRKFNKYFLFGYDGGTTGGVKDTLTHWYQNQASSLDIKSHGFGRTEVYLNPDGSFKHGNDYAYYNKNYPSEVLKTYNVNPNSNINTFTKIDKLTFLKEVIG